jgi:hypothetical protein
MGLAFRAVEMHGQRMWERERVLKVLAFMQRHRMNALVLHESDLVHKIVYPRAYFDPYALWSDLPSRRGENAIFNNRAYFHHLLAMAKDAGIAVWVNVKEIGFSDEVLGLHPELVKNGVVCPSEPFWMEYMEHKTDELFADFPGLAGMIVSFGSQESRASRVQNRCRCALCRTESLEGWFGRCIAALHAPATRHGRQLAVRDFAYKPEDHAPLIAAVAQAPADVIFCMKAMPHDFYITFPDNPAIGALARRQWVEYDVMGQFFGWGVMPCFVLTDIRARMQHWLTHGVEGGIFRIEWERINDFDALDTLNELNLIAAAALADDESVDPAEICRRWLISRDWDEADAGWLAGIVDATLPVVRHAAYMNDFVSADNSMLPRSIQRAWWGMESRDALSPWDRSRARDLELDRDKVSRYGREKDEALAAARLLMARVRDDVARRDPRLRSYVRAQFAWFEVWVEGLALTAKVCTATRWLSQTFEAVDSRDVDEFGALLDELDRYVGRIRMIADDSRIPHQVAMLIDYRRALDIVREGRSARADLAPRRATPSS